MDIKDFFQESSHPDYLDIKRQLLKQIQEKEREMNKKSEDLDILVRKQSLTDQEVAVAKRELETDKNIFRQEMELAFDKLSRLQLELDTDEKLKLADIKLQYSQLLVKESEFNTRILTLLEQVQDKEYSTRKKEIELANKEHVLLAGTHRLEADKLLLEVDKRASEVEGKMRDLSLQQRERLQEYRDQEHDLKVKALAQQQVENIQHLQQKEIDIKNQIADQRLKEVDLTHREKKVELDKTYNEYANDLEKRKIGLMGQEIDLRGREMVLQIAEQRMLLTQKEKELAVKQMIMDMIQHTFRLEERYLNQMGEKQILQMQVEQLRIGVQLAKLESDARNAEMVVREKIVQMMRTQVSVDQRLGKAELLEKANTITSTIANEKEKIQRQLFETRDREFQSKQNVIDATNTKTQAELQGKLNDIDHRLNQAKLLEKAGEITTGLMREKEKIQNQLYEIRDREFQSKQNLADSKSNLNLAQLQEKAAAISANITKEKDHIQRQLFEIRDREFQSHANRMFQDIEQRQHFLDVRNSEADAKKYYDDAFRYYDNAELQHNYSKLDKEWARVQGERMEMAKDEIAMQSKYDGLQEDVWRYQQQADYERINAMQERERNTLLQDYIKYGK